MTERKLARAAARRLRSSTTLMPELGINGSDTFAPRPMRATIALIRRMAREWVETGTYTTMTADTLSYAEVNAMFERRHAGRADDPPSAVE